jgi:arginase family enzyme
VIFFPFDLFGSGGAGSGVGLVADEFRELLADNRREKVPTRARAYTGQVRLRELAFPTVADYGEWRTRGREAFRKAHARGDQVMWVAGNHLGALPVYDELAGCEDVLVIQLDAHLDIHHFADCATEPTHGNFLLHAAGPLPPLINAGHRELLLTSEHVTRYYRRTFSAAELAIDPRPALAELRRASQAAGQVFLDIDCDVFDPSFFPAVAEPVPFGLAPQQILALIDAAWSENVAGVLISEFDPGRDQNDRGLATLVWLLEYLLLRWHEGAGKDGRTCPRR